jgi:membrane-associated phospholipid phosphatase
MAFAGSRGRALTLAAVVLALVPSAAVPGETPPAPLADEVPSTVASRWFELLYDVVKTEKTPPPQASRIYGVAAVALYEAIVDGTRDGRSLVGQLNALTAAPRPERGHRYQWTAVANAALATAVRGLYPAMSLATRGTVDRLERTLASDLRGTAPGDVELSAAHGRAVAGAVLLWAATDGSSLQDTCAYRAPASGPGWRPTPPQFGAKPLQPCWGQVRTMVLTSGGECAPPGPPAFTSNTASGFHAAALEVYTVAAGLDRQQEAIAEFWADNPGDTGTPPGHWIDIVSQVARTERLSLARAAEAYVRAGIAVHDAFIGCWNAKYVHNVRRPVTYINDNLDGRWRSRVVTPSFPSYPSGHAMQSGAVAAVLTDMFGVKRFRDTTHADHGAAAASPSLKPRTFASFADAAAEAAASRLYGGIHYAFDNHDGLASGQCIGRTILRRLQLRRDGGALSGEGGRRADLVGAGGRGRAVVHAELPVDALHVLGHRPRLRPERVRDGLVRPAAGHQREDLGLARREAEGSEGRGPEARARFLE